MLGLALLAVAAASPVCGPAAAPTVVANDVARVYRKDGQTWGCVPGRPERLLSPDTPVSASLSGPVALVVEKIPGESRSRGIAIEDLRTGRDLPRELGTFDAVTGFAAEPGGLAAWIERAGSQELVRASRGDFESHTITRRAGPLTDLAVAGSVVSFVDAAQPISVVLPKVRRTRITVTPPSGTATTPFVLSLTAPMVAGKPIGYIVSMASAQSIETESGSLGCEWVAQFGRRGPGRVRLRLGTLGAHCPGRLDGWVLATYGARDVSRCDATPMPCGGTLPLGTFKLRVR